MTIYEEVVTELAQRHERVGKNEYGSSVTPGFTVCAGPDGKARVSYTTPQPDLLDPERVSDDELAAQRHQMVDAYAVTLEAAGWRVERRGPRSRYPYLLVGHQ
ncbi:hypothetical protein [Streptomyces sp. STCH 565 A]|uniref:hypothetical protein n=1 Tax=Streptomyces sp. STCH 565 A TaxID=2950532 RepID=UPI0020755FEE|nr:hypothetical protein [Streptomyces sp. STCH 565 A]MCM8552303.1 hypothetical protein [Streptomyces sp. STCH 565 A]